MLKKQSPIFAIPVILCGGSGTRLWPLSRSGFPKQFLALSGKTSLFQQTIERINKLNSSEILLGETLIVTGEEHRFLVLDQLRELPKISAKLLLEPESKNTAPALTFAAFQTIKDGDDPVLVVTPADQKIKDLKNFTLALHNSIKLAQKGEIVVLGIKPSSPETGFGYIKYKNSCGVFGEFEVNRFEEKPDLKKAKQYIASGNYVWNSGMFVLKASVWLNALKYFRADIEEVMQQAFLRAKEDLSFIRPDAGLFSKILGDSIDYAVIEKCPQSKFAIKMIPLEAGWSDLGAWNAVWHLGEKDDLGNLTHGDVFTVETKNSLIHADHRLVSVIGIDNVIVIETSDAVLVADRNSSQQVKDIVTQLENNGREEARLHRKVYRPWGWYDTIENGDGFKVKHIHVNPGAKLSLQKHAKRAEHWVVVKGVAEVVCGEKIITLKENESTFIQLGEKHRLSNPTDEILEIIEVQSGCYLGEDDIVRFDDGYGRK